MKLKTENEKQDVKVKYESFEKRKMRNGTKM